MDRAEEMKDRVIDRKELRRGHRQDLEQRDRAKRPEKAHRPRDQSHSETETQQPAKQKRPYRTGGQTGVQEAGVEEAKRQQVPKLRGVVREQLGVGEPLGGAK